MYNAKSRRRIGYSGISIPNKTIQKIKSKLFNGYNQFVSFST